MNLSKEEKEKFLRAGGILLRTGLDKKGQPIIKKKTWKYDWHIHTIVPSADEALRVATMLSNYFPDKFKLDQ